MICGGEFKKLNENVHGDMYALKLILIRAVSAVLSRTKVPNCGITFLFISSTSSHSTDFVCGAVLKFPRMKNNNKTTKHPPKYPLRSHEYIVIREGNLIQLVNPIVRTPNMVKVLDPKKAA